MMVFPLFANLDFRQFFVKLDDAAVVVGRLPVHFQGLHDFYHLAGEGQWNPYLMGGIDGIGELLDVQFDSKSWF